MVTLINKARPPRPLLYNLPHAEYCSAIGKCACQQRERAVLLGDPATGEAHVKKENVLTPSALRIMAGSKATGLHEAVLQVGAVKRDLGKKILIAVVEAKPAAPKVEAQAKTSKKGRRSR